MHLADARIWPTGRRLGNNGHVPDTGLNDSMNSRKDLIMNDTSQHAPVVTMACAKGGVTRTTTAMQIAASLAKRGEKVVLLDADHTRGATDWAEYVYETSRLRKREDEERKLGAGHPHHCTGKRLAFEVVPVGRTDLKRDRIVEKYPGHWIIVDTPSRDADTIDAAIGIADVTIVPTSTGASEIEQAIKTCRATKNAIVLLSRVKRNTISMREALDDLDNAGVARFEHVITEKESIRGIFGTANTDAREYPAVTDELVRCVRQLERGNVQLQETDR